MDQLLNTLSNLTGKSTDVLISELNEKIKMKEINKIKR